MVAGSQQWSIRHPDPLKAGMMLVAAPPCSSSVEDGRVARAGPDVRRQQRNVLHNRELR
jgi:hypothetical protein